MHAYFSIRSTDELQNTDRLQASASIGPACSSPISLRSHHADPATRATLWSIHTHRVSRPTLFLRLDLGIASHSHIFFASRVPFILMARVSRTHNSPLPSTHSNTSTFFLFSLLGIVRTVQTLMLFPFTFG